jgi:hypothetical protein
LRFYGRIRFILLLEHIEHILVQTVADIEPLRGARNVTDIEVYARPGRP